MTPIRAAKKPLLFLAMVAFLLINLSSSASAVGGYKTIGNGLAIRSGPGTNHAVIGRLNHNSPIDIACQTTGSNVRGSNIWDKLSSGGYISDYFTTTPVFNGFSPGIPRCDSAQAQSRPSSSASREQKAVNWAIAEINSPRPYWSDQLGTYWSGWCEVYVEVAYGTRGQFGNAMSHYYWQRNRGRIHYDTNPPPGAMVFYNTGGAGHVALSVGGGQIATTYGFVGNRYPVRRAPVVGLFRGYLGWSYAPDHWRGR